MFLIKRNFNLLFNNDFSKPVHIETDVYNNTNTFNLKRCSLYQIDDFIDKGHAFSLIDEMNIITVNDKMYMIYDHYINHPMSSVELKLNMIFSKNPHLEKIT